MPDALRSLVHFPGPGGQPKGTLHSAGISVTNGYWQREGTVLHPKCGSLGICGNCPASLYLHLLHSSVLLHGDYLRPAPPEGP